MPNPTAPHFKVWPKRLPRELTIPATTLWFNLEVAARRFPDKTAYLFFGRALSYAALHRQALALAGWLHSVGVRPGDRGASCAFVSDTLPQLAS